jgi:4-amino-4-deoxy-L-arabinose transferase-like glycosyltransferase
MINKKFGRFGKLILLLGVSTALLLIWSFAVPIYESPDEDHHWAYAHYLHENWRLPMYSKQLFEAYSPPLYYLLAAPFAADSAEPKSIRNNANESPLPPRWFDDSIFDSEQYWPIRAGRFVSIVISVLTILFCYKAGVEATGDESTGLLAGGLAIFLPQFTFRGMNVSNDALVTMMCAVVTCMIVRLIKRGFTWKLGIAISVASALAFLSKTNAIILPIPATLAILSTAGPWKPRLGRLSVLGIAFLIVFPWLARNQILYGDPLASRKMLEVVDFLVSHRPITSPYFVTMFPRKMAMSFIGMFGWMNLPLPNWLYLSFGLLVVISVIGYVRRGVLRQVDPHLFFILPTFPILSMAVAVYLNLSYTQAQGRFLFPALSAMVLMAAMGLERLPFWSKQLNYYLLGILFLVNLFIVGTIIIPAYQL